MNSLLQPNLGGKDEGVV